MANSTYRNQYVPFNQYKPASNRSKLSEDLLYENMVYLWNRTEYVRSYYETDNAFSNLVKHKSMKSGNLLIQYSRAMEFCLIRSFSVLQTEELLINIPTTLR